MLTVADIGATKTVLAIVGPEGDRISLSRVRRYEGKNFSSFDAVLSQYAVDEDLRYSGRLCIAVAGPVAKNACRVTNLSWNLDGDRISTSHGFERAILLNDLVASGYGIEYISSDQLVCINRGESSEIGNRILISPGTGLGQTIIHHIEGRYVPIASEGGHADFAPFDGSTKRLWEFLRQYQASVSIEDLLSGPGLANIFYFLLDETGVDPDRELKRQVREGSGMAVTHRALEENDPMAAAALRIFLDILAAEAGNMALKGMAIGGVYIGGGILPAIVELIEKDRFIGIFSNKRKYREFLRAISIQVVMDTALPLYGGAAYLFGDINW